MSCDCPMTTPGPTLASACGGGAYMLFMGLLEVFLRSQCDLEDPCGRPPVRHIQDWDYDFIVVGGGSAGAVVAARLSEISSWRVLLIEAGTDEPTGTQVPSMFLNFLGSSIDWGYQTEPEGTACLGTPDKRCYWPRGKVLGGTSTLNGMMYIRGSRQDYDSWTDLGVNNWTYNDVLPYFLKSEDNRQIEIVDPGYHATGGPLTVQQFPYHPPMSYALLKAAEELGYPTRDVNGEKHDGFAIAQTTTRNGSRLSSAKAFIRPASQRPNLDVMLNTTVLKILINQTDKTAYGVEVNNSYGEKQIIRARQEVVLSAGAVGSPQLLLLSGIGPVEELRRVGVAPIHNLPGVGKNLHNHVSFTMNFFINDNDTAALNWATATEYLLFRDGLKSGTGISEVTGFVSSKYNQDPSDPDIQYFFGGFLADCAKTGQIGELRSNNKRQITMYPVNLHPKSRGYLTLASSNPADHPKIYAGYFTHPEDIKVLVEGIKIGIRLTETSALKNYGFVLDKTPVPGCENIQFGTDDYWECAIRYNTAPENHQVGSCKMGHPSDPNAVVNNNLQVIGIDRLRVADASVIPKITSGNTHAPTVMIGERVADMIKATWTGPLSRIKNSNNFSGFLNGLLNRNDIDNPSVRQWREY